MVFLVKMKQVWSNASMQNTAENRKSQAVKSGDEKL